MPTSKSKPGSALHEILAWASTRPDWQRDALRRIVVNGGIEEADLKDLERICRAKHNADTNNSPQVALKPLDKAHLPPTPGASESVSLVSIGELKHVNRLPSDQVVPFGPAPGLTVVYGDNGSGKSGYARVIKKACRARGVPPIIRANAFAPPATGKASSVIIFRVGGIDVPVTWTDGTSADPRLANVFAFDSFSAGHYVNEDGAAAFTPYGLDVLPTLSKTCDALRERLQQDINQKRTANNTVVSNWKYDAATEVGKLVSKLSATSKVADINALSGLDAKAQRRLQNLCDALKADPLQKAKETRAAGARLVSFATAVGTIVGALADEKVDTLRNLVAEVNSAENAARAFASGQFDATYLGGTGAALWRAMWEAGREYSTAGAYKDLRFPYIDDDARCLFCQQVLDEQAGKRLNAFENFCIDNSQRVAAKAAQLWTASKENVALVASLTPELEKVEADLSEMTAQQRTALVEFAAKADERLKTVRNNLTKRIWDVPTAFLASPEPEIKEMSAAHEVRAKTEESAHDPDIRKKLITECSELGAREWLAGVKTDVLAQIERQKVVDRLEQCEKDVSTTAITTKSTELTSQFVTDVFRDRFGDELKALGLRTLKVTLEPIKGKKGETKFGLRLTGTSSQKVVDIASEGELRCIALAAFMAELSQASHLSSLVFDDPVSSLDHWHREKIAARLVDESRKRQVIVFTHDVVFLNDLLAFAEKLSIVPHVLSLEWNNGAPGRFSHGLPWDSKAPLECLKELEQNQKSIGANWNPQPNAADVEAMRHAYSRLRSTLERIVERELLAGVVSRFESQIHTGKIDGLVGIPQSECDEARRLTKRCHEITDAHAPSYAAIPTPTELAQDITSANKLIESIRNRKKKPQTLGVTP